jgi:hypothetical protein
MAGSTAIEEKFNLISSGCGPSMIRKVRLWVNRLFMRLTRLEELKNLYLQVRGDETGAQFVDKILISFW